MQNIEDFDTSDFPDSGAFDFLKKISSRIFAELTNINEFLSKLRIEKKEFIPVPEMILLYTSIDCFQKELDHFASYLELNIAMIAFALNYGYFFPFLKLILEKFYVKISQRLVELQMLSQIFRKKIYELEMQIDTSNSFNKEVIFDLEVLGRKLDLLADIYQRYSDRFIELLEDF